MTEIAKLYGGSLYELAAEEHLEQQFLQELAAVDGILQQNPDYLRLLNTPSIPKKERTALLDEALHTSVHPYVLNFLKVLCENGTLREFSGCCTEFRQRYNAANGILEVRAVCAAELSAEQRQKLVQKLSAMTGKQIDLSVKLDPGVLGGIRLDMAGVQLDGTVRHRLDALRGEIAGAVL